MALGMATGFLFLACGRATLSRSDEAVAALLCSLFPTMPLSTNDNKYHLQAFRHLYALAVDARCVEVRACIYCIYILYIYTVYIYIYIYMHCLLPGL